MVGHCGMVRVRFVIGGGLVYRGEVGRGIGVTSMVGIGRAWGVRGEVKLVEDSWSWREGPVLVVLDYVLGGGW